MPEGDDQKEQCQEGGYHTVNAESMDEGDLNVHEVYREQDAYRGVEKRAQSQTAGNWDRREQCRESEYAQIIGNAEIPDRQAENVRIRAAGYGIASVDRRGDHSS